MAAPMKFRPLQTGDTSNPRRLEEYLRELERIVAEQARQIDEWKAANVARLTTEDLFAIRRALQSGGTAELDLTNLNGVIAEPTDARLPRVTTAPDPYTTPYDTYVLVGTPDRIYQIDRATNPPTAKEIATATTSPANMMTTDTNQTPGATVVKTWTARQVFNGGLDAAAQVHVTAGGIDVDAGGVNIDAGGLTVAAGTSAFDGQVDIGAELLLTGATVIGFADSPYTVPATISVLFVNTGGGAITINLTASPVLDRVLIIKDVTGNALLNNITIDADGATTIDGAATVTININYGVYRLIVTGSDWGTI
jgi:hypothetical protein